MSLGRTPKHPQLKGLGDANKTERKCRWRGELQIALQVFHISYELSLSINVLPRRSKQALVPQNEGAAYLGRSMILGTVLEPRLSLMPLNCSKLRIKCTPERSYIYFEGSNNVINQLIFLEILS